MKPLLLHAGPFARQVAEQVAAQLGSYEVQDINDGTHPAMWPEADALVLITDQERDVYAEMVDGSSFAWGCASIHVVLEPTTLRCGPVVIPGRTACHRCFLRRRNQHSRASANSASAVSGYLPHHVSLAAALVIRALHEAASTLPERAIGGTVRQYDLVEGGTRTDAVVAVNQCRRCRPASEQSSFRTFERMTTDLATLA